MGSVLQFATFCPSELFEMFGCCMEMESEQGVKRLNCGSEKRRLQAKSRGHSFQNETVWTCLCKNRASAWTHFKNKKIIASLLIVLLARREGR